MTNRQPIPTDALLVAIDIAKVRNEVLIEAPNHKRRRRLSVLNTRAEHDRLIDTLTLRAYGKPVICAFEATGNPAPQRRNRVRLMARFAQCRGPRRPLGPRRARMRAESSR
jgi:hypothetical protein